MSAKRKPRARTSTPAVQPETIVSQPVEVVSAPTSRRVETDSPYSYAATVRFVQQNFGLIVMAVLFFAAGFFVGSMWTERSMLRNGTPAAAAGTGVAAEPAGETGVTPEQLAALPEVTDDDHSIGNPNAQITLVEYSDFECPFCASFHPTMVQVLEELGDDVRWVYRHYPLAFHPSAQKAAEGSECVAAQGGDEAFWKYADAIVLKQTDQGLPIAAITEVASTLGIDMNKFKTCLDSGEMAEKVKADMDGGVAAGVQGTPGTFIVTKDGAQALIPGAYPLEDVKAQVQALLQ